MADELEDDNESLLEVANPSRTTSTSSGLSLFQRFSGLSGVSTFSGVTGNSGNSRHSGNSQTSERSDQSLLREENRSVYTSSVASKGQLTQNEIFIIWDMIEILHKQIKDNKAAIGSKDDKIQLLKKELGEVKASNASLQQGISDMRNTNESLEKKLANAERITDEVKATTANKLDQLVKNVTYLEGELDVVKQENASLRKELSGVERMSTILEETKRCQQVGLDTMRESYEHHGNQISILQRKTECFDEQIGRIEEKAAGFTNNDMFNAVLTTTQDLQTGHTIRFDGCVGVRYNQSGLFDERSCCLTPQTSCKMVLAWNMSQAEEGEMKVYLGMDGVDGKVYLGVTRQDGDVCSGVLLKMLEKGQRMWLEVKRMDGKAKVRCCAWMGWVIGG